MNPSPTTRWKSILAWTSSLLVLLTASIAIADDEIASATEEPEHTEQAPEESEDLSAEEIIDRAMARNSLGFESGRAQVTLLVYDRAGERRERSLDVRSKRQNERSRTLMSLTNPAEVRGQAFLFVENPEGTDDMWMYVPAFDVTRRVEGNQRRSSFLGSHFTFADLESRDLRDAQYRRLSDESIGDHSVYVIQATPKTPAESDYGRVVAYIRKTDHIPLRVRFYDKEGDIAKTLFSEKINTTDGDNSYVEQMTLRAEDGGYTTIRITALDTDVDLPDSIFDREELGR